MSEFDYVTDERNISRLINSAYPTVSVFETLADTPEEIRDLFALEMSTNPRLNAPLGRLALIPDEGIVTGDSATYVMAAFVHSNEDGGRFNDGRLGAWYAAFEVETTISETVYHLSKRLAMSEGGFPQRIQMRELITSIGVPLLNLCGCRETHPELYDLDDYSKSQDFANSIRWPFAKDGNAGILFDSVRREGYKNVCIFNPTALNRPVNQGDHYQYDWDSEGKVTVSKIINIVV